MEKPTSLADLDYLLETQSLRDVVYLSREWHLLRLEKTYNNPHRKNYISATLGGVLTGDSPYSSREKKREALYTGKSEKIRGWQVAWGRESEPASGKRFMEIYCESVSPSANVRIVDAFEFSWTKEYNDHLPDLSGTPDIICVKGDDNEVMGVELKSLCNSLWVDDCGQVRQVPGQTSLPESAKHVLLKWPHYIIQCQWYMEILNVENWFLYFWEPNSSAMFYIGRNRELMQAVRERCGEFMDHMKLTPDKKYPNFRRGTKGLVKDFDVSIYMIHRDCTF